MQSFDRATQQYFRLLEALDQAVIATDAAGAIVDGRTWQTVEGSGRKPAQDLDEHNSYPALQTAGALLRPGLTGTNVMDLVIGCCL